MYICNVCCVNINNNNLFSCSKCEYKCCKICCKKYFLTLSDTNYELDCMNCRVILNNFELVTNFGIKWIFGKYTKFKNKILYQKQTKLLDSTIHAANRKKKELLIIKKRLELLMQRKCINKELNNLNVELNKLKSYKDDENSDVGSGANIGGGFNIGSGIEVGSGVGHSDKNSNTLVAIESLSGYGNITIRRLSSFRCSYSCDGVLDEFYKCTVCLKITCSLCYSGLEEGHNCSNTINIYNISKECPSCKEYITKDDGCNIIKCINCNTSFEWNSGNINTNYQFNNIDNDNDLFLPMFNKLDLSSLNNEETVILRGMYDHIIEFIKFTKQKLINLLMLTNNKMKDVRINYLINKITDTQFKKQINKILKFENYKKFIISIIILAYEKAINVFNNGENYLEKLNEIIVTTNFFITNITKYLKYTNNIKIHHWFNLNGVDVLL